MTMLASNKQTSLSPGDRARLHLADVLDLAGYGEDAEHLRKAVRVGDVLLPHTVAMAAMLSFSSLEAA